MNTPEGWMLVPEEPTQEMQSAAERYARHHNRVPFSAGYYRAMLSAAPTPPEQPARCHWPGCPHGEDCVHAKPSQPAAQGDGYLSGVNVEALLRACAELGLSAEHSLEALAAPDVLAEHINRVSRAVIAAARKEIDHE